MKKINELLKEKFPQIKFKFDLSYYDFTSLGAGSKAPVVAEVSNDLDLSDLLEFAAAEKIECAIISGGTDFVGMDAPFDGLIIHLMQGDFVKLSSFDHYVCAGGGVRLPELIRYALSLNLGGMAKLCGIPGAVGGSVVMNAGANGDCISNYIAEVCGCYKDGRFYHASHDEIDWGYRHCSIPKDVYITGVIFNLKSVNIEEERELISLEMKMRHEREPQGRSSGCMFKNIIPSESAGFLIDSVNLKGTQIGGALISKEHANYIVNFNHASEKDVVDLMVLSREKVAEKYNFYLEPEVKFLNPESLKKILSSPEAPKVLVVMGGNSSEREISLRSGAAVAQALRNCNLKVDEFDIKECKFEEFFRKYDVIYPVLHGGFGENGDFQAELEAHGMKFVGSGSASCRLVMDKIKSKELAQSCGIPTAKWAVVKKSAPILPENLRFPLVLKVPDEGSTIGIEMVNDATEYAAALEREFNLCDEVLVEEFIKGVEITVPILSGRALTAIEIHSPHGFYDYDAKYVYNKGKTEYFCPPHNAEEVILKLAAEYSEKFFNACNAEDILRVDFIIGEDNVPYFLEGNSIPGCTATSLVPKSAKQCGISFERMTAQLVKANL